MRIIRRAALLLFLVVVILSCNMHAIKHTEMMISTMGLPDLTFTPELTITLQPTETPIFASEPMITPFPRSTEIPTKIPDVSTETPIPTSSVLISTTPTIITMENGLTWAECVVPYRDYYHVKPDVKLLSTCMDFPIRDDHDKKITGERIQGDNGSDLRLAIGEDLFEAKHDSSKGCCDYELIQNGVVILKASAPLITFDPNRNLWNIGGKLVWELIAQPPVIIVDGVNFNEKYHLEGSFFPYEINGKLIYIAKQNGKYHVVYDEQIIGPEFDEISMAYCCAKMSVIRGGGQYWFLGKRGGTQFVVKIYSAP